MGEWKEVTLGDFIDVKHGFAFKGEFFQTEPNNIILTTPGNFKIGGGWKEDKCKYYNGDIPEDYILKGGELVVTMTDLSKEVDTLGYSAIIPKKTENTYLHNQRIGLVEFINDDIDKNCLYWLMRDKEYRWHIVSSASGSTVSHTSPARIKEYEFLLPPLPEQKAIASVLSSLDDKIDLLHRQNKTLEAMAETLFRQWFVEEAQESIQVKDLLNVLSGFAFKSSSFVDTGKYRLVTIKNVQDGFLDLTTADYINDIPNNMPDYCQLQEGDILLSLTGNVGRCCLVNEDNLLLNQRVAKIQPKKMRDWAFAYILFRQESMKRTLEELAKGTAQANLSPIETANMEIQIPPVKVLEKYSEEVTPFLEKVRKNESKIRTLEKLRDTLLPKLMSGEVRVECDAN